MRIEEQLIDFILNFASCAFLTAGLLLGLRRKSSDRARIYLAVACLFSGICFLVRLWENHTGVPAFSSILPVPNLIGGSWVMILFYIYPIEAMSPGWFSLKRIILLALPCLIFMVTLIVFPMKFRELSSFGEILQHMEEPNVWFRLVMLVVIQLYVIWVFVAPHNWKKSSVSNRWVRFYASLIFCMGVCYSLSLLTGFAVINILHLFFCFVFCLLITYQELFVRIQVSTVSQAEDISTIAREPVIEILPKDENIHPLWIELNQLMKEEKLWRNPDITQEYLASLLGISRPTLSMIIRDNGFSGYKEYLNRYRIEDFLNMVNNNRATGIQEAFFNVGYRSQTTALQYFHEYMRCTPTEYMNRLSENE